MSITRISVERPVTISMFICAIVLFGLIGLSRLSVSLLPELTYPTLTVRTVNPGAAPLEVEQLISKPIEESVGIIKGIRKIQSISKPGQSDVIVEFEWGTEMNFASQSLREKLDIIPFAKKIKKPSILRFNPSLDPIIRLGLSTTEKGIASLKNTRTLAEQEIKRQLETISGVAAVQLSGGYEQQIQVIFDQEITASRNITAQDIIKRIQDENINLSAGRVYDGQQEYLVRTLNQFTSLEQMKKMLIKHQDGKNIYLQDIATVRDGEKERTDITRINGNEAIELAIYKEGNANTVSVARAVNNKLNEIRKTLADTHQLDRIHDQSEFITAAVEEVQSSAVLGGILAMIILYLFLGNFYNTIIISLAIPISVIATFNMMFANDISLNIMSLGGIALAIGLLVDNAIVVLENIARYKEQGLNIIDSALKGCSEVSGAVIASTLTTLAVFLPLAFVTGFAGQLFKDQALTVAFSLLASLFVALTIIPMLASRSISINQKEEQALDKHQYPIRSSASASASDTSWAYKKIATVCFFPLKLLFQYLPAGITRLFFLCSHLLSNILKFTLKPIHRKFTRNFTNLTVCYIKLLEKSLLNRWLVVLFSFIFAACIVGLIPKIEQELMPTVTQAEFTIEITLPQGTPIYVTDAKLKQLAQIITQHDAVKHTYSQAGTGSLMMSTASKGGENWGQLLIALYDHSQIYEIKQLLRKEIDNMPGIHGQIIESALFIQESPIQIEVVGHNLDTLKQISDELVTILSSYQQLSDVDTSLKSGQPELKVGFDQEKLTSLGLTASDIATKLTTKISGSVASKYNVSDRQVDILVRANEQSRNSIDAIRKMTINAGNGHPLPLISVAHIVERQGPNEITRVNQRRVALVTANIAQGDLANIAEKINNTLSRIDMPEGIKATLRGQNENMQASFSSLGYALSLAIFLVYIVMASQFESLLNPFIILFTVPLAIFGAILGLYLTSTSLNVIVFIGMIMLTGIVVNNAIVLLDRINQLRLAGYDKFSATITAAQTRFRPIIMTTITTILGLAPLAFSSGEGAEMRTPLAITVISGLLASTILTLIIIPVFYSIMDQKKYPQVTQIGSRFDPKLDIKGKHV